MQTLIRGGGGTVGGGNFAMLPWSESLTLPIQEIQSEFKKIVDPVEATKIYILNEGPGTIILSLKSPEENSPWILEPGHALEEEILESLWAKQIAKEPSDGESSFIKMLLRFRTETEVTPEPIPSQSLQVLPGQQFFTTSGPLNISVEFPALIRGLLSSDFSFGLRSGDEPSDFEWDSSVGNWDLAADTVAYWSVWTPDNLILEEGKYVKQLEVPYTQGKIYGILASEFFYYDKQFLLLLEWIEAENRLVLS